MKLLPLSKLTLGEVEEIEEYAGNEALRLMMGSRPRVTGKAMLAWVWVTGRRGDSSFTIEQAREIPMADVELPRDDDEADGDEPDPTSAAG